MCHQHQTLPPRHHPTYFLQVTAAGVLWLQRGQRRRGLPHLHPAAHWGHCRGAWRAADGPGAAEHRHKPGGGGAVRVAVLAGLEGAAARQQRTHTLLMSYCMSAWFPSGLQSSQLTLHVACSRVRLPYSQHTTG